jgi:pyridoxal 5'-phosphate synthase pdxT subunit
VTYTEGGQALFGGLPIAVDRNAFGSAKDSFVAQLDVDGLGSFPGVFIRAPIVTDAGKCKVLARIEKGTGG